MKSGLVSLLSSEATITAISGTRVYIQRAPQNAAFPHIIITQMSSDENGTLDGGSGQLRFLDFDIDYTKVSELDRQIQRNLCPENMLAHVFGTVSFL